MEKQGTGEEKITNLDYLLKLAKGNEKFVRDMVCIFLDENPGEIGALEKAVESRDFRLIGATAHKLRSTVPFVGIDKIISEEISEIEALAKQKTGDPMMPEAEITNPGMLSDKELIVQIEKLFRRIKDVCSAAYRELNGYKLA